MNTLKQAQHFIVGNPGHEDAKILAQLVLSLESEDPFPLETLYQMDLDRFDMALQILKDWRLDRYYAGKVKLFDLSLQVRELQESSRDGVNVQPG